MARGWESKSIESQIESASADAHPPGQQLTEEQKVQQRERANLLLSRTYIQRQIDATHNEAYIRGLRQALEEIESKLRKLGAKAEKKAGPETDGPGPGQ